MSLFFLGKITVHWNSDFFSYWCLPNVLAFFFNFYLFILMTGKHTHGGGTVAGEKERERKRDWENSHLLLYSTIVSNSWGWARSKPGIWKSVWVSTCMESLYASTGAILEVELGFKHGNWEIDWEHSQHTLIAIATPAPEGLSTQRKSNTVFHTYI